MKNRDKITIIGVPASPYTRKMLAVLRFKNIDYSVIWGNPNQILDSMGLKVPKPTLLPVMILNKNENDQAVCDSTPIIRELDAIYKQRNIIPENKALAFLNSILEDFGDEWVTKYMFHYRWHFEDDIEKAGTVLPLMHDVSLEDESHLEFKKYFSELQTSRLWVVGSNNKTAPIIEESYKRFLHQLETCLSINPFLFGKRPSSSDYAIYGQLTQLIGFDPTSSAIAHKISPRAISWIDQMEDLSGLDVNEEDWITFDQAETNLSNIFEEIGKVYIPALLANLKAINQKEKTWTALIDGAEWNQKSFPYQAKCLQWINNEFEVLSNDDQKDILNFLRNTGCSDLILGRKK